MRTRTACPRRPPPCAWTRSGRTRIRTACSRRSTSHSARSGRLIRTRTAPRTPTNGFPSTTTRRTSTRMARTTTCTSSSRSTSNPAHRRTPQHGAAVSRTPLPLLSFDRFVDERLVGSLLEDLRRGIRKEVRKSHLERTQPQPQRLRVPQTVPTLRVNEHEVVRGELVQVADERGRGMPRLGRQLDETARTLMQQQLEDRALAPDA